MIAGIRVKICGLRTLVDAEAADAMGADFLGFIFHPKSPRFVSLAQWRAMAPNLPDRKRVAVAVMPSADDLRTWSEAGFDRFQVHYPLETPEDTIAAWSDAVGADRLWLGPRLPEGTLFPVEHLAYARTVLWDTFVADGFGGSGKTGDWPGFRAARETHANKTWILAGGLSPENIGGALRVSGAKFVDVSSGVEAAPGIKDPAKLQAFAEAVRAGVESERRKPSEEFGQQYSI